MQRSMWDLTLGRVALLVFNPLSATMMRPGGCTSPFRDIICMHDVKVLRHIYHLT